MKINIPQNIKKIAQKSFTQAKKIKPGHLMFGMMLVMTCLNKCSPVTDCTNATDAKWAYEAGQQKVKDSLKILELEQKIEELKNIIFVIGICIHMFS